MKHALVLAALLAAPAGTAAAQALQNSDPTFRPTVDTRVPAADGEGVFVPDATHVDLIALAERRLQVAA